MKSPRYFIGIEGTSPLSATALLFDADERRLQMIDSGTLFASLIDPSKFITNLYEAIRGVCHIIQRPFPDLENAALCISPCGLSVPFEYHRLIDEPLKRISLRCHRFSFTSGAQAIFAGETHKTRGCALISNVASTAFACNGDRASKIGGVGPRLFEFGSGFNIGLHAYVKVLEQTAAGSDCPLLQEYDNVLFSSVKLAPELRLLHSEWEKLKHQLRTQGFKESQAAYLFSDHISDKYLWNRAISLFAEPLLRLLEKRDPVAESIATLTATSLVDNLESVVTQCGLTDNLPSVLLYGHNFDISQRFKHIVMEALKHKFEDCQFRHTENSSRRRPAALGALLFSMRPDNSPTNMLPADDVCKQMTSLYLELIKK